MVSARIRMREALARLELLSKKPAWWRAKKVWIVSSSRGVRHSVRNFPARGDLSRQAIRRTGVTGFFKHHIDAETGGKGHDRMLGHVQPHDFLVTRAPNIRSGLHAYHVGLAKRAAGVGLPERHGCYRSDTRQRTDRNIAALMSSGDFSFQGTETGIGCDSVNRGAAAIRETQDGRT